MIRPIRKPVQNLCKDSDSNFNPILENDFLSNFRNKYVVSKARIGPIALVRKLFDNTWIDDVINKDIRKRPILIMQKRTALLRIINLESSLSFVILLEMIAANVSGISAVAEVRVTSA